MSNVYKYIAAAIGGAIVGGVTSWYVTKKTEAAKGQEVANKAVAELDAYYKDKISNLEASKKRLQLQLEYYVTEEEFPFEEELKQQEAEKKDIPSDEPAPDVSAIIDAKSSLEIPHESPEQVAYHKVQMQEDYPEKYPDINELAKRTADSGRPFLITPEMFMGDDDPFYSDTDEYAKHYVKYYTKDYRIDDLTNPGTGGHDKIDCPVLYNTETERVMTTQDAIKFMGHEWMRRWGDEDLHYTDMDVVYVRNPVEKIDFCIEKVDEYYKVEILGMEEDDPYDYNEVYGT